MRILITFLLFIAVFGCKSQNSQAGSNDLSTKKGGSKLDTLMDVKDNETLIAHFKTNMGVFEIELFPRQAPKAVRNFAGLALKGYYDSVSFHRVIDAFMIQGGDPTGTGSGGNSIYGGTFEDEFSPDLMFDRPGILAMANRGPNTNTSQFFITLVPTPWLNLKHTIFGEVVSGMEVVKAIGRVPTSKPFDKPITPVIMEKVTVEKRTQ